LIAHFSVQWHIFLCNGKQENSTDTEENRREDGRERVAGLRTGGSGRQSAMEEIWQREDGRSQDGRQRSCAASRLYGNTRDD